VLLPQQRHPGVEVGALRSAPWGYLGGMSDDTPSTHDDDERPGEHGAAAEAGIVDQQDALLAEMEAQEEDHEGPPPR